MVQAHAERELTLNLEAAGCDEALIRAFLCSWKAGKKQEQLRLLSQKREGLLAQIHREEKQIHCLDYLVYRIEREETLDL